MANKTKIFYRRSIRLQGFDYSQSGAYFITICTKNHECLFGDIIGGKMFLNEFGKFVKHCWNGIPDHFPDVVLDEFVIMPDHIHGIIVINKKSVIPVRVQNFEPVQMINQYQHIIPRSIGSIIRGFKTGVTKFFRQNTGIHVVWQRNYYEIIINDDISLFRIREYIKNNPIKWENDEI